LWLVVFMSITPTFNDFDIFNLEFSSY
jgi:hypothetical protein